MRVSSSVLAIVVVTALILSCADTPRPLNVVVIGLDTLRPDHLGCYGYGRNTSPKIDRFAREGVLFENALSQAPWTHPSFATVFTSLYPTQHGATTVGTRMSASFPTLAGILKDRGYATGAIVNAPSLSPEFGVSRGFDDYDFLRPWHERDAARVSRLALEWIDRHTDTPFFIFVHYFDPHLPYAPPAPYDTLFDPAYAGPLGSSFNIGRAGGDREGRIMQVGSWSSADREHIVALYDGEIGFADKAVGSLVDGIDERNLRDKTLIVFLSDHGEEFFDHGGLDHGHSLYGELIKVPLVFSLPGRLPADLRISEPVRLLDVTPTVLETLDLPRPGHFEGVSLKPLMDGTGEVASREGRLLPPGVCYCEALRHRMTTKSVIADSWKLIHDTHTDETSLFNLEHDKAEQVNLAVDRQNMRAEDARVLADLDRLLVDTLFRISDTWFIEMVGGEEDHLFSFDIATGVSRVPAHFQLHKLIDETGEILDISDLARASATTSRITIDRLRVGRRVVLACKLDIREAPLRFNLAIDGGVATGRTYIGESLLRPVTMPFTEQASDRNEGLNAEPTRRPEPPYFLIWHFQSPYQGDTSIELDEEMKRELRALGYIQ
jgi:arylsulfatase A-like enzyme